MTKLSVDHNSPIPLHKQVENLLREMIGDPEYQDGKLLPKEVDLAKRLGISRNTIRQATNKLVHEKLLLRKKGVGTQVARKTLTTNLEHWFSFSQEMQGIGTELVNYAINEGWVEAPEDVANYLEIQGGREVLKLERLRGDKQGPFVQFISYFHPRIGLTGEEDFTRYLYEILESEYDTIPSVSKEEIRAVLATADVAATLNIRAGDPVLLRKRVVCDPGNRPIEYNIGYYDAEKFAYTVDIKRQLS